MIKLDLSNSVRKEELKKYQADVTRINRMIEEKTGAGNDFLGWVDWPENYNKEEVQEMLADMNSKNDISSIDNFDKTIKDVVIPDTVDGAPVVNVSATSITGNTTIETMVLPNSLKTITERLFYNCTNLRQVSIPDSVTEIGRYAFAHCDRLQSIVIPNSVEEVGEYCFEACLNLTSVQLSSSMKVLRTHLFASCNSLAHLEIPEGVESTEFAIVEYCDSLKSVTFPSTLKSLGNQTFFYNWGIDYFYLKCSKETWEGILETYNNDYDGIDRPAVLYYSEEAPTEAGDFWHYVNGVPTEW